MHYHLYSMQQSICLYTMKHYYKKAPCLFHAECAYYQATNTIRVQEPFYYINKPYIKDLLKVESRIDTWISSNRYLIEETLSNVWMADPFLSTKTVLYRIEETYQTLTKYVNFPDFLRRLFFTIRNDASLSDRKCLQSSCQMTYHQVSYSLNIYVIIN